MANWITPERRKRGRPASREPRQSVCVRIPVSAYDAHCRHAAAAHKPLHMHLVDTLTRAANLCIQTNRKGASVCEGGRR